MSAQSVRVFFFFRKMYRELVFTTEKQRKQRKKIMSDECVCNSERREESLFSNRRVRKEMFLAEAQRTQRKKLILHQNYFMLI